MEIKSTWLACALTLCASSAIAADSQRISLDGGVFVELPGDWDSRYVPNIAMKLPSIREVMESASDTRIKGGDTGIMASYMHFKLAEGSAAPVTDDASLAAQEDIVRKSAQPYLVQAVETEVVPRTVRNGDLGISLATLTARDGQIFAVGIGYSGRCVTTGSIRRGTEVWAISVASDSCQSMRHVAAVEALFSASGDQR